MFIVSRIDWLIVIFPFAGVLWLAFYSRKYVRGVVDFLAAGRVAGRYVISVGDMASSLSVISLVAVCEQNYQTGFGIAFWNNIMFPIGIVLALTGYCTYRWRQTRCLSKGQFIEMRYGSKSFRIITAVISNLSEMIANAIGPAIAAKFFIYYLGLPHKIMFLGISLPCYGIIVTMCLAVALMLIWPGGRISLLVTDCIQGLISYPIFVVFVGFILLRFGWNVDLMPILCDRVPQQSFLDPYDVAQLRDFNLFALVVTLTTTILNRASWIGNDTCNSGRSPHEQKMAGVLGTWRSGFSWIIMVLLAVMVYAFMNSANFSMHDSRNSFHITNNEIRQELSKRVLAEVVKESDRYKQLAVVVEKIPPVEHVIGRDAPLSQQENLDTRYFSAVREGLGDTPEARREFQQYRSIYRQMLMPVVMHKILPVGLAGLFCLLMVMLLISTDDSRIFNATSGIVQDIILPFMKTRLSPEKHLSLLRWTSVGVCIFFFIVSCFFSQMDYIIMFTTIVCALWLGGAGPIMVFGLYSRFGNLTGAWCAIIFGTGTSLLGILCQYNWAKTIYPFLEHRGWAEPLDRVLRAASSPFEPWIHWQMNPVSFPINSYEIFFLAMILSVSGYIIGSYATYRPFDLDKLLHRGQYNDGESNLQSTVFNWNLLALLKKLIGIDSEYTPGDKIIAWSVFIYSFGYVFGAKFIAAVIWNCFAPWPHEWWSIYFLVTVLIIPGVIGVVSTIWFMIGGIHDTFALFHALRERKEDANDNGQIIQ